MGLVKAANRILALFGKEIVEVLRRPAAIVSLVLGPFLILAVFGLGYQGIKADLTTIVVAPTDQGLPSDPADYQHFAGPGVRIVAVTADEADARRRLADDAVDLVVIIPADARKQFEAGEQSKLKVVMNVADPVQANYANFLAQSLASDVNREIYRQAADAGEGYVVSVGGKALASIPPEVIASPVRPVTENIAPTTPDIVSYYGPAALALILQHMAVALVALSVVRERRSGAMDLFRVSPVRATELVIGKVLAYGFLGGFVAFCSMVLLIGVLGVPALGSLALVAAVIGFLLLASLGLGMLIAVISDSERQAVQLALLALLGSMFFSGFVLRIEEFTKPVQVAAQVLPATHGIRLLQDILLRGSIVHIWQIGALAIIAAVLLSTSWALLRREFRPT